MTTDLALIYNCMLLEFTEPAILRFIEKFRRFNVDEQTIRQYIKDFETYKNSPLITIKDPNQYKDFVSFKQNVDAAKNKAAFKKRNIPNVSDDSPTASEAISLENDADVEIYKGDEEHKCVKYGLGYSFCISRPGGGNMYGSYRLDKASTFYFIYFKKIPKTDPRHILVLDRTNRGWEWTFGDNKTKVIDGGWSELISVFPVLTKYEHLFVNNPLTDKEREYRQEVKEFLKNPSAEKFKTYDYELQVLIAKSGKKMQDDVFKTFDNNLINEYVSVGTDLTKYQVENLNESQVKRYKNVRPQTLQSLYENGAFSSAASPKSNFSPSVLDIGLVDWLVYDNGLFTLYPPVDKLIMKYNINGDIVYFTNFVGTEFLTKDGVVRAERQQAASHITYFTEDGRLAGYDGSHSGNMSKWYVDNKKAEEYKREFNFDKISVIKEKNIPTFKDFFSKYKQYNEI